MEPQITQRTGLAKGATRSINRAAIVDANFVAFLESWSEPLGQAADPDARPSPVTQLDGSQLLEIYDAQMRSRMLDLVAREMRARNEGFYTIGSAGHENNAVPGYLARATDPAFLHYRSGGFMAARVARWSDRDPSYDTALSLSASVDDPASGGRHKVWGSKDLWVLPQTSTIASHLPKAVGTALALEQAKRLGVTPPVPGDSVVLCSFGDASSNHSAALGAFNSAQWAAHQKLPVPILFICEDNGLGISVHTPSGWVEANFSNRPGIDYFAADGLDLFDTCRATEAALEHCRGQRKPTFLHLKLVRLLGHAGTDVETEYRPLADVEASEARDPLITGARALIRAGLVTPSGLLIRYESIRAETREAAAKAATRPKLVSSKQIMAPLAPYHAGAVKEEAARGGDAAQRVEFWGGENRLPESGPPRHMALHINRALHDLMLKYPEMTLFGEDVAKKGGVYTLTSGLAARFRGNRVFNTLLDETTILGLAQGAGYMGLLPFPEIQYLAYYHNACDQIRGEACSLQFFSAGQFSNPMVMRVASLAYQKGFGGHFHNDNSFAALRDIPGLIIACPSRGDDAAMMLRTAAALARIDGRVVAFLEPIALYMTKDLYAPKDGKWTFAYPAPGRQVPLGEPRVYNAKAKDLLIVTYGNGVLFALQAAQRLHQASGAAVRVLDLRWLKPLNTRALARHAADIGKVLVVDEGRRTGGISEEIFTALDEHLDTPVLKRRVVGADSYIPLAAAANLMLPSAEDVYRAAEQLLGPVDTCHAAALRPGIRPD